jgi:multidrug resistance protein MdtO
MTEAQPRLQESVPWYELVRQELLPFHGRMAGSLRTTLSVCIAIVAMMTFRTPAIAPGIYLIFLISYETPYLSFTSSLFSLAFQCFGVAAPLALVIATDNSPVARVLGTAVFSFLAAFLLKTMRRRGAMDFGVFALTTLELWDLHLPANQLVELSLWPIATGAMSVLIAVGIEYAFSHRDPFYALHREFKARMQTLESFFMAYARPGNSLKLRAASREVIRFSFAGQGKMDALLKEISCRREGASAYVDFYPILLPNLFRLLDLAANLSLRKPETLTAAERSRLLRLVHACAAIRHAPLHVQRLEVDINAFTNDLIGQMERATALMLDIDANEKISWTQKDRGRKSASAWFAPDWRSNAGYWNFSLRISICSTICYIVYMALDWPGIATAVLTVIIVGLNSSGAISQKLIFRLIGSILGCIILGIGSIVFLFPRMDTITSFVLLVAGVSFIATWLARSPHISYIGMQIAYSFYLISFGGFAAPVSMAPARDRIVGIALALLVVWIAFLEIASVRTTDEMSKSLDRALLALSDYIRFVGAMPQHNEGECRRLCRIITRQLVEIRALDEMVSYEIGTRRRSDLRLAEQLMQVSFATTALFAAMTNRRFRNEVQSATSAVRQGYARMANLIASRAGHLCASHTAPPFTESLDKETDRIAFSLLPHQVQQAYQDLWREMRILSVFAKK